MKKIITCLSLALIVSSCGNKMTLLKKHYSKGFYVNNTTHNGKVNQLVPTQKVHADHMQPTVANVLRDEKVREPQLTASVKINESKENKKITHVGVHKVEAVSPIQKLYKVNPVSVKKIYSLKEETKNESKRKTGGDANIILLVILSLFPFICLIAMYLHDGNQVTLNFWICLLLHLTFVLWLVFALLVDFDIINLA